VTEALVVTGARGMLGTELLRAAAERRIPVTPLDRAGCDITDADAVRRTLEALAPRVVIHAAAWTDVDGCESDPERAHRVNGDGTRNVATACRENGARMIMVSTDYVFPGNRNDPWVEGDPTGPLSAYGASKLAGEDSVRELLPDGIVARTAWLYADHGTNFLRTMLRLAKERDRIDVVDDQRGSPTFAADLAATLLELAAAPGASGIYHVTNTGSTTWHGFASRIFAEAGLAVRCEPTTTGRFPRPARRPANSVLADTRLASAGVGPMPPWEDGLLRCLARGSAGAAGG
jgi:dTDP-4-dehydrorhamnose reductase